MLPAPGSQPAAISRLPSIMPLSNNYYPTNRFTQASRMPVKPLTSRLISGLGHSQAFHCSCIAQRLHTIQVGVQITKVIATTMQPLGGCTTFAYSPARRRHHTHNGMSSQDISNDSSSCRWVSSWLACQALPDGPAPTESPVIAPPAWPLDRPLMIPGLPIRADRNSPVRRLLLRLFPVLQYRELLQRGAVTLAIAALARLGHYSPLPGLPALLGQSINSTAGDLAS